MGRIIIGLLILTTLLAACAPPDPCGYDCDTGLATAEAAHLDFQAEEGARDYEAEQQADRYDEIQQELYDYYDSIDDGP